MVFPSRAHLSGFLAITLLGKRKLVVFLIRGVVCVLCFCLTVL